MSFSVAGTGSAYPRTVLTNDDMMKIVDTTDEWISSRTGIKKRYIATDESLAQISAAAAKNALENAGIGSEELDYIICATVRADNMIPSMACSVQSLIGASCPAFDINAACTGFIYSLAVANAFFAQKADSKILVIAGDFLSRVVDWNDRATCVLFGDAAGAVVLKQGDDLLSIYLSADGNENIMNIPSSEGNFPLRQGEEKRQYLYMNGQEVYKFAVTSMCGDIIRVAKQAGIKLKDIDYVLPHQANQRIIDAAKSRLKIPGERFVKNIDRFGNTSAASIPMLLDELNRSGRLTKGQTLALSAFGGGLTTGACMLRWS